MKLVCIVVIAIGCGERAKPAAESGSGSAPATRDAQLVDAAPSAGPDAGVDAAAAAGSPAVDPKLAARLPIEPIFLATVRGSIAIAKLDRSGVRPIYEGRTADYIAWVDAHTLIAFDEQSHIDKPSLVHRFVDGIEAETIEVAPRDWGVEELKSTPQLLATRGGEAWLTACVRQGKPRIEDEDPPCTRQRYLRVHPAPKQHRDRPPAGVEPGRSAGTYEVVAPWPKAPDAAAPAGFRVKLARVAIAAADYMPGNPPPRRFRGVVCESPKRKNTYPNATFDQAYGHVSRAVRWVQTTPPIYEITGVMTTPVDMDEAEWVYLRACDDERLAGFYALGNGVWAESVREDDPDSERWILRVDDVEIGSLPGGGSLRASGLIPPNVDR